MTPKFRKAKAKGELWIYFLVNGIGFGLIVVWGFWLYHKLK